MPTVSSDVPRLIFLALLCAALVALAFMGCEGDGGSDSSSHGTPPDSGTSQGGARERARLVDRYLANYGGWSPEAVAIARRHDLVILYPSREHATRDLVRSIQQGTDPNDPSDDVLVLGYISVGEDLRTRSLSDAELAGDGRFRGDGTGPRVDPRGPHPDGGPLEGIDPRGAASPGGSGFASWYLDDNDGDGKPDRNRNFGGAFVNAGDPRWFDVLNEATLDGPDGVAGFKEILGSGHGRGLGCDGVFLDTVDTCAPNRFTDSSSDNPSEFEWTAPGFAAFIRHVRTAYPGAVVLQNRGLFFFDPRHPHYRFSPRGAIDLAFFESFRLNSNEFEEFSPYFYPDNRFNVAPKLMAEADRPDGFRVLSLGYAEGPPGAMSTATLTGGSSVGLESLLEDIRVAHEQGFRHYLSDATVTLVNSFVLDHAAWDDTAPPQWSSTYNPNLPGFPNPPGAPPPRVGIQEVEPVPGGVTVRWDVALDMNPVRYALYYQTVPFDFAGDPRLGGAARAELSPRKGRGYGEGTGVGPGLYPYEATVGGLESGRTYYFVIRAFDTSPARHEEANRTVLTGVPP
jgi:hypothetical protein